MTRQLASLIRSRATVVWVALIVATLVSWTVGTDGAVGARFATTVVLLVAFTKVRLIGLHFMELRESALELRVLFETYCVVVCSVLLVLLVVTAR